jgi:hypothetical protein
MDTAVAPVYERRAYSPAPSDSPPLQPTALPSPKYPLRQRAPSLLRHAAVPSPLSDRFPTTPHSPDLRTIFNPLASNPVTQQGPLWDASSAEDLPSLSPLRSRGNTNASQASFNAAPPLRSVTSIPDYAQYRGTGRSNLSGTYKPNRGVANWSHPDYYPPAPPRQLRGEEPRSSYRSAWTNVSSGLMETSGTERSSIATARSSIGSEPQNSVYSRDQSRDRLNDRDHSPDMINASQITEESDQGDDQQEDSMDAVEDVIDAYCYDEEYQDSSYERVDQHARDRYSPDSDPPELSQTPSHDYDSLDSFQSTEILKQWDNSSMPRLDNVQTGMKKNHLSLRLPSATHSDLSVLNDEVQDSASVDQDASQSAHLLLPKNSPYEALYTPRTIAAATSQVSKRRSDSRQRSSVDVPRRVSMTLQALSLGTSSPLDRINSLYQDGHRRISSANHSQITEIRRDISGLPQLPMKKSRLSRQDWADIQAYSKRHSKRPSTSRAMSTDSTTGKEGIHPLQSPPPQRSQPLPEVDEDEAIPRRASTSVYDRKSTLLSLGMGSATSSHNRTATRASPASPNLQQQETGAPPPLRKAASPTERDRYGFKKASLNISVPEYNAWAARYEEHISRRRNKWIALMTKQGLSTTDPTVFPEMNEKIKRYARKGYPPEWRGAMWWYYSGGQHTLKQREMIGLYASLAARVNKGELNKDDKDAIERDLDRTFPDNIHFRPEPATDLLDGESDDEPVLIQDLREVLSCFALNNPSIGYCQSLNFIAGLLLLFLKQDKEKVFILLSIITQIHLPGAHARNLANTEVNVLMMLIKDYLPKVWASINDTDLINTGAGSHAHPNSKFQRQPTVALSCTSWFMSLFVGVLPIETVLRVWDAFLYEGPRALYRYALAIFKLGEGEIRKYGPGDGELFMTVQNLPRTCLDPNILHDFAFVKKGFGSLSQGVIDQKRLFWREQNKTIAHQNSVKSARGMHLGVPRQDDDTDADSVRKAMGGLRRKASRRFRRMRS